MTTSRQITSADVQFAPTTLTVSRALASGDNGATLVYSGSSNITLTTNTGLASGFGCTVVQLGTGIITMAAGAGVTFDNAGATIGINTFLNVVNVSSETYAHQNAVTNQSRVLIQSGIPFILVSSGSIGNNGALTGVTALPTTYTSAYLYFPADAIAVGVAAGWYYTAMSGTTAGTIKNNVYTSGQPTIPASPTAFATTGPGAYTQTISADIMGPAYTLPGGTLGTNGRVRISVQWGYTNSANTKTFRAQFDGTNLIPTTTATTSTNYRYELNMQNDGVATKQVTSWAPSASISSTSPVRTSIDTSVNKDLKVGMQLANAADNMIVETFSFELLAVA